jgi:hypothetical protein
MRPRNEPSKGGLNLSLEIKSDAPGPGRYNVADSMSAEKGNNSKYKYYMQSLLLGMPKSRLSQRDLKDLERL